MKGQIVIIGAPRSGTNMLRDALTCFHEIGTWPCDEINYIWRHGNIRYPSDEFTPEMATVPVASYIRGHFSKLSRRHDVPIVVEKTCANSLRVGFVDRVLPDARYIFIRRNGLDVVTSAMKRWNADFDPLYIARKARYVPPADLPYYASRYLWNRVYRLLPGRKRLAFWGPRLNDMQRLLEQYTLAEVCGLQWQRCLESAAEALYAMPEGKVHTVIYETFVSSPAAEIRRLVDFIGLEGNENSIKKAAGGINASSIGKWRSDLDQADVAALTALIGGSLKKYGYL